MYLNQLKKEVNQGLENIDEKNIQQIAKEISHYKNTFILNNIYITGIGKSKHFATHMADILKSLSYTCFFFDITDALHGNIGLIKHNDMMIVISRSGNTDELIIPLQHLQKKIIKIVYYNNFVIIRLFYHRLQKWIQILIWCHQLH